MPSPHRDEPSLRRTGESGEPGGDELFVQLITANHDHLRRSRFTLVPHEPDAQDVMEEVCLTLSRTCAE